MPFLAFTHSLWPGAALVVSERFGKAVRTPARDTMLAQASTSSGRGMAFALHEALDQSGALLGPLLVTAMLAASGFHRAFASLAIPAGTPLGYEVVFRIRPPDMAHSMASMGGML